MPKSRSSSRAPELRIIGGRWRSRKLMFRPSDGLRPTGDRIRETLFNWLQSDIRGARVLDLFAGSGALGFESASRGARQVVLVEANATTAETLRRNCDALDGDQIEVVNTTAQSYLSAQALPFDVLFLDPPFGSAALERICSLLEVGGWLAATALIYVETPRGQVLNPPETWQLWRQKATGNIEVRLFRRGD